MKPNLRDNCLLNALLIDFARFSESKPKLWCVYIGVWQHWALLTMPN